MVKKSYFKKAKEYEQEISDLKNEVIKYSKAVKKARQKSVEAAGVNKTVKTSSTGEDVYVEINNKVADSIAHTGTWSAHQQKWHKLRMRIKKARVFPFVGCSNIRMPTAEIKIRKVKAALNNAVFGIRPICQAIPSNPRYFSQAQKIERFLDHLAIDVIDLQPKSLIATDQATEKGFYLLKPYWRTEITTRLEKYSLKDLSLEEAFWLYNARTTPDQIFQQLVNHFEVDMSDMVAEDNIKELTKAVDQILRGKNNISLELQDVLYNFPDVAVCDPERVYVPTDAGYHPQTCQWIVHEFFMPYNQVKANVKHRGWSSSAVEEIEAQKEVDPKKLTEIEKDTREGIERINNPSKQVKIWEYYGWYDINDDGVDEKCVITIAPEFKKVLRKITLPFNNGKWPFVKLFYELTDDRWFAHRGIPEILEDIIKEIDIQHMQKIDQQTIRNAPMFVYRAGMVNPNLITFTPNAGIPVSGMQPLKDTIDIVNNNNSNVEYSYEREQMLLETKAEELIGQIDFTLQSMINKREPRTLGEVQMQQQNMQMVFSLDVALYTNCFTELFNFIWDLWCQYGDDSYEFSYFGKEGYEPIRMSKEEIQGKYKITIRGNDQNTNPQVRVQKAQMILADTYQALQMGLVTPVEANMARKKFYQELDIPDWQSFVPQQPPAPPKLSPLEVIKPKFSDLSEGEQAQVLVQGGIKPDGQGRSMKKRDERFDIAIDQITDIAKLEADIEKNR